MNTENTKAQLWFNCVNFPDICLERHPDCKKLISTPDGFSTGDSPTTFECTAMNVMECPLYIEHEANCYSTSEYLEGKTRP